MKKATLTRHDLASALPVVSSLLHRDEWIKAAEAIAKKFQRNRYWSEKAHANVSDITALAALFEHKKRFGRLPRLKSREQVAASNLALRLAMVQRQLSQVGRKRLSGMIRSGVDSDNGLGPVLVEIDAAFDLEQRGWSIRYVDLEGLARFDLLAEKQGAEIEVECKYISADAGRKVHQHEFSILLQTLNSALLTHQNRKGGHLIEILVDDRLLASQGIHSAMATAVNQLGPNLTEKPSSGWVATYRQFDPQTLLTAAAVGREQAQYAIAEQIDKALGVSNVMSCSYFDHSNGAATILVVRSRKPDRVIQALHKALLGYLSEQFSGKRPGFLYVRFADLDQEQLRAVAERKSTDPKKATALQRMANSLLRRRPHLHTLIFIASGAIVGEGGKHTTDGITYTFKNENNAFANDQRYDLDKAARVSGVSVDLRKRRIPLPK